MALPNLDEEPTSRRRRLRTDPQSSTARLKRTNEPRLRKLNAAPQYLFMWTLYGTLAGAYRRYILTFTREVGYVRLGSRIRH